MSLVFNINDLKGEEKMTLQELKKEKERIENLITEQTINLTFEIDKTIIINTDKDALRDIHKAISSHATINNSLLLQEVESFILSIKGRI
jgi:hypothetical protein